MKTTCTIWLLLAALLPARLGAVMVLLLSTGDKGLDDQTKALIMSGGNTVTIGSAFTAFDGTEGNDLSGIDVVMLLPNFNWATGDMPLAGQTALLNFVNAGGGLVTSEWTNWKVAAGDGSFKTLSAILPVVATTQYTGGANITYTQVTADSLLHAGVPLSFSFATDNFAGVESFFSAKPGATVFYSSSGGADGAGLVGWNSGAGRVMQFSTVMGRNELTNPDYALLVKNSINWAAIPEPATSFLLLAGLGGMLWSRKRPRAVR